jgi:hypothetical protein
MKRTRLDDESMESEPAAPPVRPKLMGCIGADGEVELYREQPQVAGQVNQLVDATTEQCGGAAYDLFAELLPELNKPREKK